MSGCEETYKVYVAETKFKGKKIRKLEQTLTYHHLEHKVDGGPTTLENGAVINELAHRYIHSLPRQQEEIINNMLREFKLQCGILIPNETGITLSQPITIDLDFDDTDEIYGVISVFDTTQEDLDKRFNRAKVKRETQKDIENGILDYYEDK